MEAQSLLSRFCSNSTISLTHHTKKLMLVSFPSSCTSGFICQQQNGVPLKPYQSLVSQRFFSKNKVECRNSLEETNFFTGVKEAAEPNVKRKRLAVFVSGGGSNFRSIHEATLGGTVRGDIVVLVTNKQGCGGAEYARDKGIPVLLFPKVKDKSRGLTSNDLVTALREFNIDFILLAGYLNLIPAELIQAYPKSILNIHPSLLPAFGGKGYYGTKVHKAVIASGARYSGPTIHFVDEHYDTGRILAQRVVPVFANDTADDLAARVLREEHRLYVEVTAALCEDRIAWREDGVPLIQSNEDPDKYS